MDFKRAAENFYKKEDATNFEVEIASNGVDLFFKENYPSMRLLQEQGEILFVAIIIKEKNDLLLIIY